MTLEDYGWDSFFAQAFQSLEPSQDFHPGRVVLAQADELRVLTAAGEVGARATGRLRHQASARSELPAVGDWVACRHLEDQSSVVRIHSVLPRKNKLSRKRAGRRFEEQVVAANVEVVLVVMGLDGDYNLRRLERMLTAIWECGARPVVVLNKEDLCRDVQALREQVERVVLAAPVLTTSLVNGSGVDDLRAQLRPRETVALFGSSGAGKSTLINRLLGEDRLRTRAVRTGDDRGRHTTTHRELVRLSSGALLVDNPGIRELQLWNEENSLEQSFEDIETLASRCRFEDCMHDAEPGCAVSQAVSEGHLPEARLSNYRTLQKELRYLALKQDESAKRIEKKKWRAIHKSMRKDIRHRRT